ncbi:hypothetical protein ACKAV7_011855 [Fusarium commune]
MPPLPRSHSDLINHPMGILFEEAETAHLRSHDEMESWTEIPRDDPRTKGNQILDCMWVYVYKFGKHGRFQKCKARLVVRGDQQARTLMAIAARFDLELICNAEKFKETEVIERGNQKLRVSTRPHEGQGMADYVFDFVLLADEAVLKHIERGEYVVKAVSLRWNDDLGWGWVRIPTGYLLDLWTYLMWNDDRTENCPCFDGSEEDLAHQIWPGDTALHYTGDCSEVRSWRHYSNQNEMY